MQYLDRLYEFPIYSQLTTTLQFHRLQTALIVIFP